MDQKKRTVLIVTVIATLLCAVGTFTKSWRSASRGDRTANVGLRSWEECRGSDCESATWSDVKGKAGKSSTATIGPITFFVGIAAVLLLAALAAALLKAPDKTQQLANFALGGAGAFLGLGLIYIMSFPSGFMPVGWSAYVGWLGGAGGIAASVLAKKLPAA